MYLTPKFSSKKFQECEPGELIRFSRGSDSAWGIVVTTDDDVKGNATFFTEAIDVVSTWQVRNYNIRGASVLSFGLDWTINITDPVNGRGSENLVEGAIILSFDDGLYIHAMRVAPSGEMDPALVNLNTFECSFLDAALPEGKNSFRDWSINVGSRIGHDFIRLQTIPAETTGMH
jgi:hypothetical protein